jgi:hypothetical protein
MVCMTDHKTTASWAWLTIVMNHRFFQCVWILTVIIVTLGSLLVYLEVKMEVYIHPTGSHLNVWTEVNHENSVKKGSNPLENRM